MAYLIAIIRALVLTIVVIIAFFAAIILSRILPAKIWTLIVRLWAKSVLLCVGVTIKVTGNNGQPKYISPNRMVVANHISWLDIPILYTIYWINFIGRAEMQGWPILSTIIKSGGTVFINRSNKRELIQVNDTVSQALKDGKTVGLFPEGRTSSGENILPFKSSLLEASIIAGSTIVPAVIKYYKRNGLRATEVSYAGDITLYESAKSCLLLNGIFVEVTLLPEFSSQSYASRDELSSHLYNLMKEEYDKDNINVSTELKHNH